MNKTLKRHSRAELALASLVTGLALSSLAASNEARLANFPGLNFLLCWREGGFWRLNLCVRPEPAL